MCRLSWNLGTSTSWNPQGLSRPVMGLLYLIYIYIYIYIYTHIHILLRIQQIMLRNTTGILNNRFIRPWMNTHTHTHTHTHTTTETIQQVCDRNDSAIATTVRVKYTFRHIKLHVHSYNVKLNTYKIKAIPPRYNHLKNTILIICINNLSPLLLRTDVP